VYVLRSVRDGKTYTGSAEDLERRLSEHARGHVRSTRHRRPLVLAYVEEFATKEAAMARERFLKTPEGGVEKHRLLAENAGKGP
jgi:putative endonuclease